MVRGEKKYVNQFFKIHSKITRPELPILPHPAGDSRISNFPPADFRIVTSPRISPAY